MYSTLVSVALFSALAIQGALADFTVDTPTVTQCEPVHLTWDSTNSKSYDVAIVSASDPCDDVLAELGAHTVNHITWTPTVKPGTQIMISVLDADDNEGWSGTITVKDGGNTSCLATSSASSSASLSASASSASVSGTTLVVNPAAAPSSYSAPAAPSSSGASVVGAANSGVLGDSNGAFSVRFSAPSVALGALVAVAALAL